MTPTPPGAMKRGDTSPSLDMWLTDAHPSQLGPADLSAATKVRILGRLDNPTGALLIDREIADRPADGHVVLVWEPGDTDTVGDLLLEVEVTWPDGSPQTFPVVGYLTVRIREDLG